MIESAQGKILFSDKELACRHCGKLVLAPGFAEKLKELRLEFGLPMTLSSCCRCSEHNRQECRFFSPDRERQVESPRNLRH